MFYCQFECCFVLLLLRDFFHAHLCAKDEAVGLVPTKTIIKPVVSAELSFCWFQSLTDGYGAESCYDNSSSTLLQIQLNLSRKTKKQKTTAAQKTWSFCALAAQEVVSFWSVPGLYSFKHQLKRNLLSNTHWIQCEPLYPAALHHPQSCQKKCHCISSSPFKKIADCLKDKIKAVFL